MSNCYRGLFLLGILSLAQLGTALAQSVTTIITNIAEIPAPTREARQNRDVRIDDVVVSIAEIPPRTIRLDIANDPRFHYAYPLNGVTGDISEGNLSLQLSRYEDWFSKTAADPSLYPAPASMSVFPNAARQPGFIVRLDNATFVGAKAYISCRPSGNRQKPSNTCIMDTPLTDQVRLHLQFDDDRYPVDTWPEFLKSIEAGVRQIVSRCEKTLLGERCRH